MYEDSEIITETFTEDIQEKKNKKALPLVNKTVLAGSQKQFYIIYNSETAEVLLYNEDDYKDLMDDLKAKSVHFHPYTNKRKKQDTFVIRGLSD